MKSPVLVIVLIGVAAVASAGGLYYYYQNAASNQTSLCHDPDSISSHVYHPYRLDTVKSCITASGIVQAIIPEADGDYHIRLALDPQYRSLTNSANGQYQYGDLVVEIICASQPITQQDAVLACEGYTNNITLPSVNDNITVTGPYVLDTDHNNWAEIHPVYSLTVS